MLTKYRTDDADKDENDVCSPFAYYTRLFCRRRTRIADKKEKSNCKMI